MSDQLEPKAPTPERADPPGPPGSEAGDAGPPRPKRRRGSRGGRNRNRTGSGSSGGASSDPSQPSELPEPLKEGRPQSIEAADRALVRKPQIGDSRPAPKPENETPAADAPAKKKRRRGGRGRGGGAGTGGAGGGGSRPASTPVRAVLVDDDPLDLDDDVLESRRGRERKGRPLGRYLMCAHVQEAEGDNRVTQIA